MTTGSPRKSVVDDISPTGNDSILIHSPSVASLNIPSGGENAPPGCTIDAGHPIENQLTVRSVVVGGLVGSVITASNMYIGLKTGWGFGASLFSAILGFAVIKPLSSRVPPRFGGGYFGPKENCTLQTSGAAAGGLSSGFVSAIPALAMFGYRYPYATLTIWTICSAYYGLFFAVPLRSYAIIKQKLRFPSGTATAYTIKAMHDSVEGGSEGRLKALLMMYFFLGAFLFIIFTTFFRVFYQIPIFWYFSRGGTMALWVSAHMWGWTINLTPAFIGGGMLMGMNASYSFLLGSFLAWGVIGPSVMHVGWVEPGRYRGFSDPHKNPSAQFWLLWPGVMIMLCASFTDLFMNYRVVWRGLCGGAKEIAIASRVAAYWVVGIVRRKPREWSQRRFSSWKDDKTVQKLTEEIIQGDELKASAGDKVNGKDQPKEQDDDEDPAPPHERIPTWLWLGGLLISSAVTIGVMAPLFHIAWYEILVAILLAFVFSFIGVQTTGETDINPIGVIGKVSQFVFAGITPGQIDTNLIAGNIAGSCAAQGVDMLQDLKTGHILCASPRSQFYAQIFGSLFGIALTVATFTLFADAYPCILSTEATHCPLGAPAAKAWYGVALALSKGTSTLPTAAPMAALIAGIIAILVTIFKKSIPPEYGQFVPSMTALGIAFVNPSPYLGPAMFAGSLILYIWEKKWPVSAEKYGYSVASGLAVGEGIGGVVQAVFLICGLTWASSFGMPPEDYVFY